MLKPLLRHVDTYGGIDIDALLQQVKVGEVPPLLTRDDFGKVDLFRLEMMLKSRVWTEML